jgi:hypothetical protein
MGFLYLCLHHFSGLSLRRPLHPRTPRCEGGRHGFVCLCLHRWFAGCRGSGAAGSEDPSPPGEALPGQFLPYQPVDRAQSLPKKTFALTVTDRFGPTVGWETMKPPVIEAIFLG